MNGRALHAGWGAAFPQTRLIRAKTYSRADALPHLGGRLSLIDARNGGMSRRERAKIALLRRPTVKKLREPTPVRADNLPGNSARKGG